VIAGAVWLLGRSAAIGVVGSDVAVASPALLVAVTFTRTTAFASSPVAVCVRPVAPGTSTHVPLVVHRCHW
jgi:hypothetical protein